MVRESRGLTANLIFYCMDQVTSSSPTFVSSSYLLHIDTPFLYVDTAPDQAIASQFQFLFGNRFFR